MDSTKLLLTALHVLVAWIHGCKPVPAEVDILRTAFPSSADLPVDELACQVVHDLSGRTFMDSERMGVEETDSARVA